jgi:hypothetical protein
MSELEKPQNPDDSIAKLHHMSTTAGMGSGDYVEINPLAIASIALALASLLGIVFMPFLLLGLLGLIAGIYSLLKIRRSNGTQGGKLIAALGIFISLAVSGSEGARQAYIYAGTQRDIRAIQTLTRLLGEDLAKGDMIRARDLFSDDFKNLVSQELFNETLSGLRNVNELGAFQGLEAKGPFNFAASGDGTLISAVNIQARFEKTTFEFTTLFAVGDAKGNWKMYNLSGMFKSIPKLQF